MIPENIEIERGGKVVETIIIKIFAEIVAAALTEEVALILAGAIGLSIRAIIKSAWNKSSRSQEQDQEQKQEQEQEQEQENSPQKQDCAQCEENQWRRICFQPQVIIKISTPPEGIEGSPQSFLVNSNSHLVDETLFPSLLSSDFESVPGHIDSNNSSMLT